MSNSKTKKVEVTITRYYYKTSQIEVEVPTSLKDEDLVTYLTEDNEVDEQLEEALYQASLNIEDTEYHYNDIEEKVAGTL